MYWLRTHCDACCTNPDGVKVSSFHVWLVIIIKTDGTEHYLYGFRCPLKGCRRVNLRELPHSHISDLFVYGQPTCIIDLSTWESPYDRPKHEAVSEEELITWNDLCCNPSSESSFYSQLARHGMIADSHG